MDAVTMIDGYRLEMTCSTSPEQYDVFRGPIRVGYLRLRHGDFRADFPECGGDTVYAASPDGFNEFGSDERERHLRAAVSAIDRAVRGLVSEVGLFARSELGAAPAMNWQPIETAPMDGETYVLIYQANEDGTPWVDVARWYEGEWLNRDTDSLSTEAPTHWAPLVAPDREG